MKKIIITGIAMIAAFAAKTQDYHISHYDVATLYLNPAMTGFYGSDRADYRFYFDQRSQWKAIGIKPYLTSYLAYDKPQPYKGKNFGLGGYILNNNGGIGNFNTLSFMLSGAYDLLNSGIKGKTIQGRPNIKHLLTIGLQMGFFYRSTNPNDLNYDVQYRPSSGTTFDQSIPNNEAYNRVSLMRFDASYGVYYKLLDKTKKIHPFIGFSLAHLTRPNESLTGGDSKMPLKWLGHGGCDIKVDDKIDLTPRVLWMMQSKAMELSAGLLFYYRLTENDTKLIIGADYRVRDAAVISLGLKHESYTIRFSYDINTSYLKNYTRGRGAFEVSFIYIGEKGRPIFQGMSHY